MFKETQQTTSTHANDNTTKTLTSARNQKPKFTVKEVPKFDGDPKKWVKWIKSTEAFMGQTGYKTIMESQVAANKDS